jgi:hypothetical protein
MAAGVKAAPVAPTGAAFEAPTLVLPKEVAPTAAPDEKPDAVPPELTGATVCAKLQPQIKLAAAKAQIDFFCARITKPMNDIGEIPR